MACASDRYLAQLRGRQRTSPFEASCDGFVQACVSIPFRTSTSQIRLYSVQVRYSIATQKNTLSANNFLLAGVEYEQGISSGMERDDEYMERRF